MSGVSRSGAAVAALLALGAAMVLGGCSESGDEPGGRPGASAAAGRSGPANQSASVLDVAPAAPQATVQGKIGRRERDTAATIGVIAVHATTTSTVLTYELSAAAELRGVRTMSLYDRVFPDGVLLVDKGAKRAYGVGRLKTPTDSECVCSPYPTVVKTVPARLTAQFGPLPEGLDTVEVRFPGFAAVSVPVTRD